MDIVQPDPCTEMGVSDLLGDQSKLIFVIILSCLTTAVILSVIVNIFLFMRMKRSRCEHCAAGTPSQHSQYGKPYANTSDQQLHSDDDALNYTALKFTDKKSTKPRRQRREQREEETIYSGVSDRQDVAVLQSVSQAAGGTLIGEVGLIVMARTE